MEVASRSVRDHFIVMERKHKFKMGGKEQSTGIAGEDLTKLEELLEEFIEISEETEKRVEEENESKRVGIEREKVQQ